MSFRGRLRLFFALIVIVPMIALGVVLFALTARTETGKADAGIGTAARTAIAVHREGAAAAAPALRRTAADPRLQQAVVRDRMGAAERRMRELVRGEVVAMELWSADGRRLARVGSLTAVAWRGSELVTGGVGASAVLTVSVTNAPALVRRIRRLTELDAVVLRHDRKLASTVGGGARIDLPPPEEAVDIEVAGSDYRGRVVSLDEPRGAPLELAILRPTAPFSEHIADNRLLIAAFLVLFVVFAIASATFVSRALTGQIATFLAAARRLSRGDFRQLVPVEGNDEFAQL